MLAPPRTNSDLEIIDEDQRLKKASQGGMPILGTMKSKGKQHLSTSNLPAPQFPAAQKTPVRLKKIESSPQLKLVAEVATHLPPIVNEQYLNKKIEYLNRERQKIHELAAKY